MQKRVLALICLCLLFSIPSLAQLKVPAKAITVQFPDRRASFKLHNVGDSPLVVQVDLARRTDVYVEADDGLAILYPRVSRLEPGATQNISVTWRGKTDLSHYYLVRVNTVNEDELRRDRSDVGRNNGLNIKIGQAFPLHIEAPQTRPQIEIDDANGQPVLHNTGGRGDHVETLRLANGRLVPVKTFLVPGQKLPVGELTGGQGVAAVKLRRFGWVTAGGS